MSSPTSEERQLSCLPIEVLASICALTSSTGQHSEGKRPLLTVCPALRDAALQTVKRVELCVDSNDDERSVPHLASMLNRACCAASPGLEVKMKWHNLRCKQKTLTALLLQPASKTLGWRSVHSLVLYGANLTALQLRNAFPALRTLELQFVDLKDTDLLLHLQNISPQLQKLTVSQCKIHPSAVAQTAAAVGELKSLRAFEATADMCLDLGTQLTGLTSLVAKIPAGMDATFPRSQRWSQVASHNHQLTTCKLIEPRGSGGLPTKRLQQLLASCPGLTELDVPGRTIDQAGLDAILADGSNITSLGAEGFLLGKDASRATHPCSWNVLHIHGSADSAQQFASLPLHSVQTLSVAGSQSTLTFNLPPDIMPAADMPHLVYNAASNLAACPAIKQGDYTTILLNFRSMDPSDQFQDVQLGPEETDQLLENFAPLEGYIKHFIFDCKDLYLSRADIWSLSRLGPCLTKLSFRAVHSLSPEFWASLPQAMPRLTDIFIGDDVGTYASAISLFCGLRAAAPPAGAQPLTITLSPAASARLKGYALRAGVSSMAEDWNTDQVKIVLLDRQGEPVEELPEYEQVLEVCDGFTSDQHHQ